MVTLESIALENGISIDLAAGSGAIPAGLGVIGNLTITTLNLQTKFKLGFVPDPTTIIVDITDLDGTFNPNVPHSYVPTYNEVHLTGYAGGALSTVTINYCEEVTSP